MKTRKKGLQPRIETNRQRKEKLQPRMNTNGHEFLQRVKTGEFLTTDTPSRGTLWWTGGHGWTRLRAARTVAAATAWVLLALAVCARAEDRLRYEARPGSKVEIAGTSTLHDWMMDGQIIGGFLELPAGMRLDPSRAELPGATGGKLDARVEA